jgi:hypothetical protein
MPIDASSRDGRRGLRREAVDVQPSQAAPILRLERLRDACLDIHELCMSDPTRLLQARRQRAGSMIVDRQRTFEDVAFRIAAVRADRRHPVERPAHTISNVWNLRRVMRLEEPAAKQPQAGDRRHEPGADDSSWRLPTNRTSHRTFCDMGLHEKSISSSSGRPIAWHAVQTPITS